MPWLPENWRFLSLVSKCTDAVREIEYWFSHLHGLHPRQTCLAQAPLNQIAFPLFQFGGKQRFEKAQMGTAGAHRFGSQPGALCRHRVHAQTLTLLFDRGFFQDCYVAAHHAISWLSSPS